MWTANGFLQCYTGLVACWTGGRALRANEGHELAPLDGVGAIGRRPPETMVRRTANHLQERIELGRLKEVAGRQQKAVRPHDATHQGIHI